MVLDINVYLLLQWFWISIYKNCCNSSGYQYLYIVAIVLDINIYVFLQWFWISIFTYSCNGFGYQCLCVLAMYSMKFCVCDHG
jgi:hypothetical protein